MHPLLFVDGVLKASSLYMTTYMLERAIGNAAVYNISMVLVNGVIHYHVLTHLYLQTLENESCKSLQTQ